MRIGIFHARSREYTVALALLTAVFVLSILLFPERAFQSSLGGLTIWWNIVFPSMLPFLMLSEMMAGFGAVRGFGTLMEPLMRLAFRIPGLGGWAIALGAVTGMPAGAEAAGKLRRENLVSREEGERILALSHVASPFFVLTVIGAGFLHNVETGAAIAVIHYVSAIATGLLLRGVRFGSAPVPLSLPPESAKPKAREARKPILLRALSDMHHARLEDGRTFGKLLGDSVSGAIQTLMMIGGIMIVFSVLLGVMDTFGIARLLAEAASRAAPSLSAPLETIRSGLSGLFELHIGTNRLSQIPAANSVTAALIGAALAWSGLAVHLQVKTAIRQTDLRYRFFLLSRIVHAGLSFVLTLLSWRPITDLFQRSEPSFLSDTASATAYSGGLTFWWAWTAIPQRIVELGLVLAIAVVLSLIVSRVLRPSKTV
ncbi:sporulation protein [Paenibacillus mesophilus]|uniref:sporulation protein n=1 Tax=Paenibacillus mesophilus TaxID=2582849 RepID=UPI00110DFB86|nr:sporulation protein [Paenibacillus mesophilus]TMV51983.1 sporulation protein [Paenibacillus mesophilus]